MLKLESSYYTINCQETEFIKKNNHMLISYVLDQTKRPEDGHLIIPLMWNESSSHLLGRNMHLSQNILKFLWYKLQYEEEELLILDEGFRTQRIRYSEPIHNQDS